MDPRNRRGGSVIPSSPYEVYTAILVEVRKGADSPKPPQERRLQGRSHAAETVATRSIRSNTSRRMKVWGEPVSRRATHLYSAMASPPLCIAILVVNETSLASQYPRRGRGRVLTAQGQGIRQTPSPNLPDFDRPALPRNRSKTPKDDLGKRWPRSTSTTAA